MVEVMCKLWNVKRQRALWNNTHFLERWPGPAPTVWRYTADLSTCPSGLALYSGPFHMFKCKWSGCSYRTPSYFGLKWHKPRCSHNLDGRSGSALASSSTLSTAMTLQGPEIRAAKEDAPVEVSVDSHVVFFELGFEIMQRRENCSDRTKIWSRISLDVFLTRHKVAEKNCWTIYWSWCRKKDSMLQVLGTPSPHVRQQALCGKGIW